MMLRISRFFLPRRQLRYFGGLSEKSVCLYVFNSVKKTRLLLYDQPPADCMAIWYCSQRDCNSGSSFIALYYDRPPISMWIQ